MKIFENIMVIAIRIMNMSSVQVYKQSIKLWTSNLKVKLKSQLETLVKGAKILEKILK